MNKLTKKLFALTLSGAMMAASIPTGFAAALDEYVSPEVPNFKQEANAAERTKTETLSASKPVTLRQMEYLKRSPVAIKSDEGVLVTWRFLGTDPEHLTFNIYRDGTKLNSQPIKNTNYLDKGASASATYDVIPVLNGAEVTEEKESAAVQEKEYLAIPVKEREGDYDINDASVGDLDGDGTYEIVVRRDPANMDVTTRKEFYPLIEAYKMDGTHLWTIDIGPNEINTVDINFLVYDFDQDGKSEIVTRSFEGTTDGTGAKIGDENGDGKTDYSDSIVAFPDRQYLSEGPEFLSIYEGMTGKELARTELLPKRDDVYRWSDYKDLARNVKRASHHLFAVAYLDGVTPSIVYLRGAWNAVGLAAWNYKNNKFEHLWTKETDETNAVDNIYGAGYHSLAVADVDFDGKDEILSGALCVDNDGTPMYATQADGVKLGHGDAFDVAFMDPDFDGYLVWACHETKELPTNIELHDARTGEVLYGFTKPKDTGRSRAADIDPTNKGWEMWGSTKTPLLNLKGETLSDTVPSMNMKVYWDGDLLSELLDHENYDAEKGYGNPMIEKWDWTAKKANTIMRTGAECASLGGTKGQVCLAADIWGDWRDEVMVRTADNKELRIYSTNIPTDYRIPTMMHDVTYREAIAWQNNHYNQPANVSYYLGAETTEVPVPEIYTMKNGKKIVNSVYENSTVHATVPIFVGSGGSSADTSVVLKIGSSKALSGGNPVAIDSKDANVVPVILAEEGRTMVPLRFLSENFGASIDWAEATQTITITRGSDTIVMVIGADSYSINGETKPLDAPAQIMNDRTMVPIRAVLEAFGKQLYWNEANQIIAIGDTAPAPDDATLTSWADALK